MTNPRFDDDENKPLDPAVAQVARRVRRLILIAGLTLGLGIFAVFAVILYRIVTYDATPTVVEVSAGDSSAAEAAIRSALAAWNAAFNAGNTELICDLFAPDLRYFASGLPEQTYDDMCARLKATLADTTRTFAYSADVHEVIVTGDSAIVRLTWTLTSRVPGEAPVTSVEQGMDYFQRQPDGSWRIARFVSYQE